MDKGYLYIFTGNGKGKTSAALGVILRAAGAGRRCLLIQFMKVGFPYSELAALLCFEGMIDVEQFGDDDHVLEKRVPTIEERAVARQGLTRCRQALLSGEYDLIILDEVCPAVHFGLLDEGEVAELFSLRTERADLLLTGRYCPPAWIEAADVVTEMTEIKHYYTRGVTSRKGIDC